MADLKEQLEEAREMLLKAKFSRMKAVLTAHIRELEKEQTDSSTVAMDVEPPVAPVSSMETKKPTPKPSVASGAKFVPIEDIAWDQGEYGSQFLTIYVDLPGVIEAKDRVKCDFGQWSFDLTVMDFKGKNYRVLKDNLEKDILPESCSFKVKNNKIVIKLAKKKGEFSYENWNALTSKKKREAGDTTKTGSKTDPKGGIMDMMKNLYDEGDDATRKAIGEAMLKSRSGDNSPPDMPDMGAMDM
jgi:calcyclin binding protein